MKLAEDIIEADKGLKDYNHGTNGLWNHYIGNIAEIVFCDMYGFKWPVCVAPGCLPAHDVLYKTKLANLKATTFTGPELFFKIDVNNYKTNFDALIFCQVVENETICKIHAWLSKEEWEAKKTDTDSRWPYPTWSVPVEEGHQINQRDWSWGV